MDIRKTNSLAVPHEQLRWYCNLEKADFSSTDDLEVCDEILGQERALKALELGLNMEYLGYNIYITGKSGTGRHTTIRMLLQDRKRTNIIFDDKCYVHNFKYPDMPRAISLPAGQGNQFKKDMENLVNTLKEHIPAILESDRHQGSKDTLTESYKKRQQTLIKDLEDKVKAENFTIVQIQIGPYTRPDILPVIDEKPTNLENLETLIAEGKMTKEESEIIKKKHQEFSKEIIQISKKISVLQKDLSSKLSELEVKMITPLVDAIYKLVK